MLFKLFLALYIEYAISITAHEMFHFLMAKMCGFYVKGIYIGEKLFRIRIGRLYFSPLMRDGYTEIELNPEKQTDTIKIGLFFCSGVGANLLLIFLSYLIKNDILRAWLFLSNVVILLCNCFPFVKDNDCCMFIKYCIKKGPN